MERLGEHTETDTDGRHILPQGPDGLSRFPFSDTYLPLLYSLTAALPVAPDGHPRDAGCRVPRPAEVTRSSSL